MPCKIKSTDILALMWFFIHFALEVICFQYLVLFFGKTEYAAFYALMYDVLAFFTQIIIGRASDIKPRLCCSYIGSAFVLSGAIGMLLFTGVLRVLFFAMLSLGNAFVHIGGAKATLHTSGNRLAPVSVFVSGGAFGVITGRLLGSSDRSFFIGLGVMLFGSLLIFFAEKLFESSKKLEPCVFVVRNINPALIVISAFFVVSVRGLMGYGIPMAWKKTWTENLLLFCMMGVGKAAGGILSDRFGARKVALVSGGLSVPFLLLGNNIMWSSLLGIALFSMTMCTTLGMLLSVMKSRPLTAFGITTVGLLTGTLLAFIPGAVSIVSGAIPLTLLSVACFFVFLFTMKGEN